VGSAVPASASAPYFVDSASASASASAPRTWGIAFRGLFESAGEPGTRLFPAVSHLDANNAVTIRAVRVEQQGGRALGGLRVGAVPREPSECSALRAAEVSSYLTRSALVLAAMPTPAGRRSSSSSSSSSSSAPQQQAQAPLPERCRAVRAALGRLTPQRCSAADVTQACLALGLPSSGAVHFADGLVFNPAQGLPEGAPVAAAPDGSPRRIGAEWGYLSGSLPGGHDRRTWAEHQAGARAALQPRLSPAKVQHGESLGARQQGEEAAAAAWLREGGRGSGRLGEGEWEGAAAGEEGEGGSSRGPK
jgi:hypothetical protein